MGYTGETTYKFGDGLSYTQFSYSSALQGTHLDVDAAHVRKLLSDSRADSTVASVSVKVTNMGSKPGDEVSLLFMRPPQAGENGAPLRQLRGFTRTPLSPGQTEQLEFEIT